MTRNEEYSILFVCMGNICRSPMAEAIFRHKAILRDALDRFSIDSAGTGGWHAGDPPDSRMQTTARRNGVTLEGAARQVRVRDFKEFDLILCMDDENHEALLAMGAPGERVRKMLEFDPEQERHDVPDPYYGEHDGFQHVFDLLDRSCEHLLDQLLRDEA